LIEGPAAAFKLALDHVLDDRLQPRLIIVEGVRDGAIFFPPSCSGCSYAPTMLG
jgi:hypothetical protein